MEKAAAVKRLDLGEIQKMAESLDGWYADGGLFISMDYKKCGSRFLRAGQPYILGEGRVMRILSGEALAFINLEYRRLEPGMCFVVPPHSVFEIESLSSDFQLQVFSFCEIQGEERWNRCEGIRLEEREWQLAGRYFSLIWEESCRAPVNMPAIRHLQSALLARLEEYCAGSEARMFRQQNNGRLRIFRRFTELIGQYGAREHHIGFYAGEIGLSPNYLGAVVKAECGSTGAELINRSLVIRAKIMLKYSEQTVGEIAEELNFSTPSAFCKFFRRETGRTPFGYRSGKAGDENKKGTGRRRDPAAAGCPIQGERTKGLSAF